MLKQDTNSKWLRQYKETITLTPLQRDIVVGTLLGDGSLKLSRSGKSARLQICHSVSAKDYVFWKHGIFKNWVFAEPRNHLINNSLIFRTISHSSLFEIMQYFYIGRQKIVPKNIHNILKNDISLAVWFMDDGNGYLHSNAYRISTYAFGLEGNILLQDCLRKNFGLFVNLVRDSKGYQIYIPTRNGSALKFKNLITPYVLPSMNYKLEHRSPVETYIEGTR